MPEIDLGSFLNTYPPGSHGDDWTWDDEHADLWTRDSAHMLAMAHHLHKGGTLPPVTVGDDGRVWDGHHRVVAHMHLGRRRIAFKVWADLTEEERAADLLDAIGDAETAGRL